ncbi:DNA repair protein endonuclease SAE2/CtIP C-terminus-domain-containing protein [Thelonectria olida]|uniref:DNA repair protein endonuclease SAE2/CtIP C-terminus-domain-containing protein n=1 Tax=Thelonectria olida TaxID=1576542 RepID=A0A9P8WAA6_9HYPO|nr:DNA repair protein endonuclease SAE2/CtIP C-terminus-domain-containing protein [Thelonectria olida]
MATFFTAARAEILQAVNAACERADQAITKDLELAKRRLEQAEKQNSIINEKLWKAEAKAMRTPVKMLEQARELESARQRIDQVEKENSILRERLSKAEAKASSIPASTLPSISPRPTDGNSSEPDWKAECARVSSKFNALSENFKKAKDALRKRKDERDRWIEHAELLEKRLRAAEEAARTTVNPDVKVEREPSPNTSFTSDAGLDQADLELPPLAAASLSDQASDAATEKAANPQSESTQGESEARSDDLPELPSTDQPGEVQIKEAPSSDQPVFVSERAVKKRKRDGPEPSETPPRKIKAEPSDESSPLVPTRQNVLDLQESIDLGEVAQKMATPRKRRELDAPARDEQAQRDIFEAAMTTPVPLHIRPDPNPQTARPLARSSALTPLSVNRRMIQSGGDRSKADKPASLLKRGLSHGLSSLAEDGGVYKKDAENYEKAAAKPVAKGRLDALLNSRSAAEDESLTRSPRPRARASLVDDLSIPGRRELPFERERRSRDTPTNQPVNTTSRSAVSGSRLQLPDTRSPLAHKGSNTLLRHKPPSELGPDDFKINPLANDGHDFAYTEVVRNKDERGAMSGCTDMHCCGKKFRALALSQRPNPPLTPAQRQEEQKLLENYLGELAYRLTSMNKEDRDELWIEAKTQELADKYGKHRHRYSRMQSPPGYWNPDFPSTQELEAERAEAARREKQTVQDRYREAMRPGGRWMFRDE